MPNLNDYVQVRQDRLNWCWAAVGVSMARYHRGESVEQCEFVKRTRNSLDCLDVPERPERALDAAKCFAGMTGRLTLSDIKTQLSVHLPIALRLVREGFGHLIVVTNTGVDESPSCPIMLLDPARPGLHTVPFSALLAFGYQGWRWTESYFTA